MRSEETHELMRDAATLGLLAIIALRARWRDGFNVNGLKAGEALIGDYQNMGLTRQQYRSRLANLQEWRFVTTKPTSKGTIVNIINARVFDIFGASG